MSRKVARSPEGLGTNSITAGHGAAALAEHAVSAEILDADNSLDQLGSHHLYEFLQYCSCMQLEKKSKKPKEANPMSKLQQGPF